MPLAEVQGTTLHFERYGANPAADRPPVVLIHGLGSSGADWAFQIPALAREHHLIVPDLRGSGLSAKPDGPYCIEAFAEDLWALLDHLRIGRAALVGFSLGGAVSSAMALQQPERCSAMVMINSLPSFRVDAFHKWLQLNLQVAMVRLLGMRRTARVVSGKLFPAPHQHVMAARVVSVLGALKKRPYLATVRALAGWCGADRLDRLGCRTLMLAAENDYTTLRDKQTWATRMGAQLRVVRGSRHGTPFDSIAATNQVLAAFLAHHPVPESATLSIDSPDQTPSEPPDLRRWLFTPAGAADS